MIDNYNIIIIFSCSYPGLKGQKGERGFKGNSGAPGDSRDGKPGKWNWQERELQNKNKCLFWKFFWNKYSNHNVETVDFFMYYDSIIQNISNFCFQENTFSLKICSNIARIFNE